MIIDIHTHCYPDFLAAKAISKIDGTNLKAAYDGTYHGLIQDNKRVGIDKAVVLCIANRPSHQRSVNEFAVLANSNEELIAFGSVHPFSDDYKYYVDFLCDNGIKGMKFQPFYQDFYVNDKQALKVYEYIASKGMVLFFHSGVDLLVKGEYCAPEKIREVIDCLRYPKTVIAHMGCWGYGEKMFELIVGQDVYLDTSFSFRYETKNVRKRFIMSHSADKILFGTDRPWTDAETDIKLIKELGDELSKKILGENAKKLLNL